MAGVLIVLAAGDQMSLPPELTALPYGPLHGWTLSTLRRLMRGNELMGCRACAKRRKKAFETRKRIRDEKVARLTKGCDEGDQNPCRVLR